MGQETAIVIRSLRAFLNRVVVTIILEVIDVLTSPPAQGGTPIKTGWARSNWIPSIGEPVVQPFGSPQAVGSGAQDAGISTIRRYKTELGPAFISNPVPYILQLNAGSSTQAAAGFIERAVDVGVQNAAEKLARTKP